MMLRSFLLICCFLSLNSFGQNNNQINPELKTETEKKASIVRLKLYPIWFVYGVRGEVGISLFKTLEVNLGAASYYKSFYWEDLDANIYLDPIYENTNGYTFNVSFDFMDLKKNLSVGLFYQYKTRTSDPYSLGKNNLSGETYAQQTIENNAFALITRLRAYKKSFYDEAHFLIGLTKRKNEYTETRYSDNPENTESDKSSDSIYLPSLRPGFAIGFAF